MIQYVPGQSAPIDFRAGFQYLQQQFLCFSLFEAIYIFDQRIGKLILIILQFFLFLQNFCIVFFCFLRKCGKVCCNHVLADNFPAIGMRACTGGLAYML